MAGVTRPPSRRAESWDATCGRAPDRKVLRSVAARSALTEVVLETSAVRLADPSSAPSTLVETLAWQLSDAGLRPSFGPSWTLLSPGADLSVGTWGLEDALETFVAARPAWRRLPR